MLQDMTAGRTTEIDFLNGYVIKQAEARGVKVRHADGTRMPAAFAFVSPCIWFTCRSLSTQPCIS
jgi:hypothetical protein